MDILHNYQLFLFDFDGILVNTELLHYKAYQKMCADRRLTLPWDFKTYTRHAMFSATGVREGIYDQFPELERQEPSWEVLYQEKKETYYRLLQEEGVELMPGIQSLLERLADANIKRCVVTHSPLQQIALISEQQPILKTIPVWITREDYREPKPSPECYQQAIKRLAERGDRIIGFEDSPRGLKALLGTEAEGVLISDYFEPDEIKQVSEETGRTFSHFPSFSEMLA